MKLLAEGLGFLEGPAWSEQDQRLFFVDWTGNRVLAWDGQRIEHVFSPEPGGGPSGLGLSSDGNFWLSLYDARKLALYSPYGQALLEITHYQGQPFRGVCDLANDAYGDVYFTDSGDFEEDWRSGRPAGAVYYLPASGDLQCVDRGLRFPNGLAVTPDGDRLYVNEHRLNRTLLYERQADRRFGPRQIFYTYDDECLLNSDVAYELGPDGACLDSDGCLWAAHYGGSKLIQISPTGRWLRSVRLPRGGKPTNLAWRASARLLYVTEAEFGLLYQIEL
jgi:gluconolactonase